MEVIILGAEAHNCLNVARTLGRNGINPIGIVVSNSKIHFSAVASSKYWKHCYLVQNEKEGLDILFSHRFLHKGQKCAIITTTDRFAEIVDQNYNLLSKIYICPGVPEQGKLTKMMDKKWQYDFAVAHDIPIARSYSVPLSDLSALSLEEYPVPCILKPESSFQGVKGDITICETRNELENGLKKLKHLGYTQILLQEYLKYDYEMLLAGAILKNSEKNVFVLNRILRSFPPKRGTSCYRKIILDPILLDKANSIINALKSTGYVGPIDIELFKIHNKVYLNEYNLRDSGASYVGSSQRFDYFYWYIKDLGNSFHTEDTLSERITPSKSTYSATEGADLHYPMFLHYGWKNWIKDMRRVSDFAYLSKDDPKPAFANGITLMQHLVCSIPSRILGHYGK